MIKFILRLIYRRIKLKCSLKYEETPEDNRNEILCLFLNITSARNFQNNEQYNRNK